MRSPLGERVETYAMKLAVLAALAPAFSLSLAVVLPHYAHADEAPAAPNETRAPSQRFGSRGVLVVSSDARGTFSFAGSDSGNTTESLALLPSVDYFVAPHLSVGGSLEFGYDHQNDAGSTVHELVVAVGPRVGYEIPLGDVVSLWPKARLQIGHDSTTFAGASEPSETIARTFASVDVYVPFLFHPATHFFLGAGPAASRLLVGDNKYTTLGVSFTVGGWVGL